ncbi:MAG TPA: tryptophan--tRNA ligase [Patescibacteria group bacterium]|nr:tryptophan--tRNA ligase [Patescibacteria group bacterium]
MSDTKEVVLTGLRTNAEYHIGNYLGAILPMMERANNLAGKYQINLFAPDLHSFTTPVDHLKLYDQTIHNLKLFVAAGLPINNPDVYIYRQSFVPAVSELSVILQNFAYFGELSRMTQFKDKGSNAGNNVTGGLFTYPVLMAADILIYGAKWVPVGDDQTQHLEFARDLGQRINNKFGNLFVIPEPVTKQHDFVGKNQGTRIRSLKNPETKMSKSVEDPAGTIQLSDKPTEAAKKVMAATTDSVGIINFDWQKQPGITNLLQMLALLTHKSQDDVNHNWQGNTSYGDLKTAVAEAVSDALTDLQKNFYRVDDEFLQNKLLSSEKSMNEIANKQLLKVQQAVGLRSKE